MPTYFDPVLYEDVDLSKDTTLYLVVLNEDETDPLKRKYVVKGVSADLQHFAKDPHTNATQYWPIDHKQLESMTAEVNALIFPDGNLTSAPLSLDQVKNYFHFNPNGIRPLSFNPNIAQELRAEWQADIIEGYRNAQQRIRAVLTNSRPRRPPMPTPGELATATALSHGIFTTESMIEIEQNAILAVIRFLHEPGSIELLENNIFSANAILGIALQHDTVSDVMTPECLTAITEGLFTGEHLAYMNDRQARLALIHPNCIQALRSNDTTIAELQHMSGDELQEINRTGQYPAITVPALLELDEPLRTSLLHRSKKVGVLVNEVGIPFSQLIIIEESLRDKLINCSSSVVDLVRAGVTVDELLVLDEARLDQFLKMICAITVAKIMINEHIPFYRLAEFTPDILSEIMVDYQLGRENQALSTLLTRGPGMN